MYASGPDPYCYPGTGVLRNLLDIRDPTDFAAFEASITAQRAAEPLPRGRLGTAHYRAIHRHLFQDVFDWAGELRTVRIAKGGNMFCYPENIHGEITKLFEKLRRADFLRNSTAEAFARDAAHLLADLNAIHPFREGNGRTQLSYLVLLSARAGHFLWIERMDPAAMLDAMVQSFTGDERRLAELIAGLLVP